MTNLNDQLSCMPIWRKRFLDELSCQTQLAGKRILEVGCGDGALSRLIAQDDHPHFVYATDLGCRLNESDNLLFLPMSVTELLFPDSYFDIVFSHNVLEHVHNLEQGWREIKRVLKPQGVFYSHFAPLWSHAYGHHFYTETDDSFSCILPPYAHLYMSPHQIKSIINQNTIS